MDNKTFIDQLSRRLSLTKEETSSLVDTLCDLLVEASEEGDIVSFPGFGNFEAKRRLEREGVHPASGKRLLFPPKISLVFKPSSILKQKIRNTI